MFGTHYCHFVIATKTFVQNIFISVLKLNKNTRVPCSYITRPGITEPIALVLKTTMDPIIQDHAGRTRLQILDTTVTVLQYLI